MSVKERTGHVQRGLHVSVCRRIPGPNKTEPLPPDTFEQHAPTTKHKSFAGLLACTANTSGLNATMATARRSSAEKPLFLVAVCGGGFFSGAGCGYDRRV